MSVEEGTTKQIIGKAYLALLEEGGTKIITVKDVVDRAGVSRMTFYYHFHDIYELVDWIYRHSFSDIPHHVHHVNDAWHFLAMRMIEIARTNEGHILDNYQHLDHTLLNHNLSRLIHDLVQECFDRSDDSGRLAPDDVKFFVHLLTFCMTGIMQRWFEHDLDFDPADYVDRFDRLIREALASK